MLDRPQASLYRVRSLPRARSVASFCVSWLPPVGPPGPMRVATSLLPAARATLALATLQTAAANSLWRCGAVSRKFISTSCPSRGCWLYLSQQERTRLKVVHRVRHLGQWSRLEEAIRPSVSGIWSASPGFMFLSARDPLDSPCEVRAKGQALTWTVCVCVLRVVCHTRPNAITDARLQRLGDVAGPCPEVGEAVHEEGAALNGELGVIDCRAIQRQDVVGRVREGRRSASRFRCRRRAC